MTIMLVHNETLIAEARGRHRDARDTLEALEAARRAGSDVPQRAIDNWRAEVGRTREECRRLRAGRLVRSGKHAHVTEAEARRMLESERESNARRGEAAACAAGSRHITA